MVSSVLVELMRDAGELGTRATDCGEAGNSIGGREVALGVCEEDIFCVEVKLSTGHWAESYIVGN